MSDFPQESSYQNFEDYYETIDRVNVHFNLKIESIYENNLLFSSPEQDKQQKSSGMLKLYFKIVDFNNPSNTTIINSDIEMSYKSSSEDSISNSDCYLREVTTGSQSIPDNDPSNFQKAKSYENYLYSSKNTYYKQGKFASLNMQQKKSGYDEERCLQKQKRRGISGINKQDLEDENMIFARGCERANAFPYKQRKSSSFQCEEIDKQHLKDEFNRILMNQQETSQSEMLFNLYNGNLSQQHSPQVNPLNQNLSRASKVSLKCNENRVNEVNSSDSIFYDTLLENMNQQLIESYKSKCSAVNQSQIDSNNVYNNTNTNTNNDESLEECYSTMNKQQQQQQQQWAKSNNNNNNNNHVCYYSTQTQGNESQHNLNENQDISTSKLSSEQNCIDSSTVITRTRRIVSPNLVMLPLLNELPKKKSLKQQTDVQEQNNNIKEESNGGAGCKGNAVNMAKNILKGFMEYVFTSAKEDDLIECCNPSTPSTTSNYNPNIDGLSQIQNQDQNGIEASSIEVENDLVANSNTQNISISKDQLTKESPNQDDNDEDDINCDKMEEDCDQKEDGNTEIEGKDKKSVIDSIRKRFRKQYNSKMLEKPSNSKLLKLFSNNNYGKLFKHYFSSEEIMRYIESSNIQNKHSHKDLVEKIRGTSFDIEKLQDVLKTRIFKRPPFQKPQK